MSVLVGPYRLEEVAGHGASGVVWRARRTGPVDGVVAVKRLHEGGAAELARFRHEAAVLARLDHPHVVRVLDVLDDGDAIALVLQWAPGGSLGQLLHERGSLTAGEVVAVAAPIADALASAHRRGVVHGDVKPANVLFTSDGEPLLSDFGVARLVGSITPDHRVAGTTGYLAPELLAGVPAHQGSDIFALGVLCYEALTGRAPDGGPTPYALRRPADGSEHHPLAEHPIPPELAAVVAAAIAAAPEARPPSADDVARALRAAVPSGSARLPGLASGAAAARSGNRPGTRPFGPAPPAPRPDSARPSAHRWARVAIGLGTLGAVGLAAAVVAGKRGDDADRPDAPSCAETALDAPAGAQRASGDTTGRHCSSVAVYAQEGDAMVLTVRLVPEPSAPARFGLGHPGDVLLLGDWDCDGLDTAALYRPVSGEVRYFDDWAPAGAPSRSSRDDRLPAGIEPRVVGDATGCDALAGPT